MNRKEHVSGLIHGVRADMSLYCDLLQSLELHYQLLSKQDTAGLITCNEQQLALMAQVKRNAKHRKNHLLALNLTPDKKGMALLIAKLPEPLSIQMDQQWLQLKGLLQQCQHQNDANGRLLAGQMELLNNLMGNSKIYEYEPYQG